MKAECHARATMLKGPDLFSGDFGLSSLKMTHSAVEPHSSTWAVVLTLLAHSTAGITVAAGSAIASASGEPGRGRGRRAHDHRNLANALCPPLNRRQAPQSA